MPAARKPVEAVVSGEWNNAPAVDLSGVPKVWFMVGPGGSGKTTEAKWLIGEAAENNRDVTLAALDPANRSLASWFENVEQPPNYDGTHTARWLREFLDYLMADKPSALLDFGGGDVSLSKVLDTAPGLHDEMEKAGTGVVVCYTLTPRIDDLGVLRSLEKAGFQPKATVLLLNEGRADVTVPREESFAGITRHSIFRSALNRGAVALWMPALESDIMLELEQKRLHFGMARDGRVPVGKTYAPISGLRRRQMARWMERMEKAHEPIRSWLP